MRGDQHQRTGKGVHPGEFRGEGAVFRRPEQRVDDGIAGDENARGGHVLRQQVVARGRSGGEVQISEHAGQLPVHLLGIW